MNHVFPEPDIPLNGMTAYRSQSDTHQLIFMQFEKDTDLPEHSHAAQIGIVLEGKIELVIDGKEQCFTKVDRYYIPEGIKHSGKIYARYADITFKSENKDLAESDIEKANIEFKVDINWINNNEINYSSIRLLRYNNDSWQMLNTIQYEQDQEYIYYSAETTGFSTFAVVGSKVVESPEKYEEPEIHYF